MEDSSKIPKERRVLYFLRQFFSVKKIKNSKTQGSLRKLLRLYKNFYLLVAEQKQYNIH